MDKEIKIEGLNMYQVAILDKLWSMATMEEFNEWVSGLSKKEMQEAELLKNLLLIEVIDSETADLDEYSLGKTICQEYML